MRKKVRQEIDIDLRELPVNLVKLIKLSLNTKSFSKKINARSSMVKMGKTILPHLYKLLDSKNGFLRMEAAKIIELIADRKSIPVFVNLLDDKEFEIRWIAAEGLIKIGRKSILPLLKSVRDGQSSYFHNMGVHHVLESVIFQSEKKKLVQLLRSLEDYHELGEIVPVEASKALKTVFKCND